MVCKVSESIKLRTTNCKNAKNDTLDALKNEMKHTLNIPWTYPEDTLNILWTCYYEPTMNLLWTYSEHTLNISWTYSEDICPRIDKISKTLLTHSPTWIQEMLAHLISALSLLVVQTKKPQWNIQTAWNNFWKIGASVKIQYFIQWFFYVKFWNWNNFVYRESCSAERLVEVAWLPDRAPKLWDLAISRIGEHGGKFGEHGEHGKYQPDDLKHSACFEMLRDLRGNNTSVLCYCMCEGLKFL